MATSAEVFKELLHAYLPVGREQTLDAAWTLADSLVMVWPVEVEDVRHLARSRRDIPDSERATSSTWRAASGATSTS